jgi:hypothetical protein
MDKLLKYQIIEDIISTEDEEVLKQIKMLLEGEDFWNNLDDDSRRSIDRGLSDFESNRIVSHEKIMEKYRPKGKG